MICRWTAVALALAWTGLPVAASDAPADGLYRATDFEAAPKAPVIHAPTRASGVFERVVLGERIQAPVRKSRITSHDNANTRYTVAVTVEADLPSNAPVALVVGGQALAGHVGGKGKDDSTLFFEATSRADAEHFATFLGVDATHCAHPGHRLVATFSSDPDGYVAGQPMPVTLTIRNAGNQPVSFVVGGRNRGPRDNQFRFLGESGTHGVANPVAKDAHDFGGLAGVHTLAPGRHLERTADLAKWFDLVPGVYGMTGLFETTISRPDFTPIWQDALAGTFDVVVRAPNQTPPLAAGQVWTYETRPEEPDSRAVIGRIEKNMGANGVVVHVRLEKVRVKNPHVEGGSTTVISHIPITQDALRKSLRSFEGRAKVPDLSEGYATWRKEYDSGSGGVFTTSLADVVRFIENAINTK